MGKKKIGVSGSKKKTRKEKRKEQRIQKKVKKNEHYFKRFKKVAPLHPSKIPKEPKDNMFGDIPRHPQKDDESLSDDEMPSKIHPQEKSLVEKIREASEKSKILAEKRKVSERKARNAQLREANKAEEKQIKHLSTLMKMNKRKKKGKTPSLPKIFASDGLDYLLDVTDPEKLKDMKGEEPAFDDDEGEGDFERDLALATGAGGKTPQGKTEGSDDEGDMSDEISGESEPENEDEEQGSENDAGEEEEEDVESDEELAGSGLGEDEKENVSAGEEDDVGSDFDMLEGGSDSEADDSEEESEQSPEKSKKELKRKLDEVEDEEEEVSEQKKTKKKKRKDDTKEDDNDGVWEDIYGRMRGKDGSILTGVGSDSATSAAAAAPARYIPPALRAQQLASSADERARRAQLRRRLQGQLNRLSAASARGVLALLEELYASHSRHDTSQTLTELVHEACVSPAAVRPDRMVMEHVLLLAALHANVGSEVGAHFLLMTAQRFHKLLMDEQRDSESKELDCLVMLLAHLYTFRVTDSTVIYDILKIMVERFSPKDVELILTVLRSVGFTMRKDDPAALKELILRLQAKAAAATAGDGADSSRVRFLLDIVMALRNNNMAKIPNYDPVLGQELNKLLKTLVNPSQTLTELSISLEDLLKAEERGKWWVVGSAWSGTLKERQTADADPATGGGRGAQPPAPPAQQYSAQLLELARQQRMNTDLRRNVFCVIMSAEDYLDGFEKLMRLGLKGPQQEQEMVTVIVGCALRERTHNPYYSHLLERLCAVDRKYQMRVKISVWEHLKQLPSLGSGPASNLAKVLSHLISAGQLTIAVLKVVEFSEMSKPMVRFLRQLLLALLMSAEDPDTIRELFQRASGAQLKHLRDSLVLFIHHFVLRNKNKLADGDTVQRLEERAKVAVSALKAVEGALRL
ncbi:nucleolar MIF4G domain-containing protein 1-like [Amphibalanus amphitrite]|uniref:nucleolar MIF4G domain-containing protein 1-like n=1 Tax=Amphibalanus amphitrite TaxID=1232801 RepID=UPI001C91FAE9|nr:nucleolar MIF4G domain-containing protein 1-like [Amphibalanus amphitrite]XP_043229098.1 nucleolar MIF4G domain-containing protein 1-like [Amphibalanus amphitrite]XP_043229099.1 nucleolar MIF4G domain-containing protein 1-like [Amphibalanus amphitrite]XP_043229100.1 nucleolar MIF4G domain-containing protein 1-like [Amphibalanus amphitrite]XP_043229101.1 nucleolar MIF4G domain-containing protein 1-like [Amphibalanus amphitrite]XP_043229102.1 nucleolar MIF4G domain-containing protein 1-like [